MKNQNQQSNTINNARPSSPRSVAVRGIGAAHTLYPAISRTKTLQDDVSGMTACVVRGFTLIELLVVVLIVSILTAAALSGYNFAVEKTKYTSLIALGNKIWTYEKYYKLANGQFTNNLSKLEIQLSDPNLVITFFGSADFSGGWDGFDLRYKKPYSPVYRVFLGKNWVGRRACIVDGSVANQKMARKVCDHFAGQTGSQASYYITYFKENLK